MTYHTDHTTGDRPMRRGVSADEHLVEDGSREACAPTVDGWVEGKCWTAAARTRTDTGPTACARAAESRALASSDVVTALSDRLLVLTEGEEVRGKIHVSPNPKNHRDIDIRLEVGFDGACGSSRTVTDYKLR